MTNLNKFAAQQLTKKQMNDVKGGAKVSCDVIIDDVPYHFGVQETDMDYLEFEARLHEIYGDLAEFECQPWLK